MSFGHFAVLKSVRACSVRAHGFFTNRSSLGGLIPSAACRVLASHVGSARRSASLRWRAPEGPSSPPIALRRAAEKAPPEISCQATAKFARSFSAAASSASRSAPTERLAPDRCTAAATRGRQTLASRVRTRARSRSDPRERCPRGGASDCRADLPYCNPKIVETIDVAARRRLDLLDGLSDSLVEQIIPASPTSWSPPARTSGRRQRNSRLPAPCSLAPFE